MLRSLSLAELLGLRPREDRVEDCGLGVTGWVGIEGIGRGLDVEVLLGIEGRD